MEYRTYHIYIITNKNRTVLYTGVTSNLKLRLEQHKTKSNPKSFSARYNLDSLVYYEQYFDVGEAIVREKQIKNGSRHKKIELINSINSNWVDLYDDL